MSSQHIILMHIEIVASVFVLLLVVLLFRGDWEIESLFTSYCSLCFCIPFPSCIFSLCLNSMSNFNSFYTFIRFVFMWCYYCCCCVCVAFFLCIFIFIFLYGCCCWMVLSCIVVCIYTYYTIAYGSWTSIYLNTSSTSSTSNNNKNIHNSM